MRSRGTQPWTASNQPGGPFFQLCLTVTGLGLLHRRARLPSFLDWDAPSPLPVLSDLPKRTHHVRRQTNPSSLLSAGSSWRKTCDLYAPRGVRGWDEHSPASLTCLKFLCRWRLPAFTIPCHEIDPDSNSCPPPSHQTSVVVHLPSRPRGKVAPRCPGMIGGISTVCSRCVWVVQDSLALLVVSPSRRGPFPAFLPVS